MPLGKFWALSKTTILPSAHHRVAAWNWPCLFKLHTQPAAGGPSLAVHWCTGSPFAMCRKVLG